MAAVVLFILVFLTSVKIFSYGVWEAKRKNAVGGIFAIVLAVCNLFFGAEYLIRYLT